MPRDWLSAEELQMLAGANSPQEWSRACDAVKGSHGGYPHDWYEKVLASGLARRTLAKFGATDQMSVVVIRPEEEN